MVSQQQEKRNGTAQIIIPPGARLGDNVIEAQNLNKGFGDRLLIENLSFSLPKGGIVGVIGPNGAGKTTLFRMITGSETPDGGTFKVGESVVLGYVDQSRDALTDKKSVWEEISGGAEEVELGKVKMKSRAYCSAFNFKGSDQQKTIGMLSGGERNRVHLAKLLRGGANLLLLDEPTNDLDVDTLRSLEEGIMSFAGSVVVITHDRWFLDRLATHIIAFEGDGYVHVCEGNFEVYERSRKERLGLAADEPHRFRYKKLQH
jgi:ATPase subunit of ABC transporter with duplicated ATPase domains